MHTDFASVKAPRRRIVVTSIGNANPGAAAVVARGLGAPVSSVVARLYRAPAVLAEGVEPLVAERMVELLSGIGFGARSDSEDEPFPEPSLLFDVALYVSEPRSVLGVVETLAAFTGVQAEMALEMILTPPGLVLGAVSKATIEAFKAQLPPGVEVVYSRPEDALYHLFLIDGPEVLRARLTEDLAKLGITPAARSGLIASGVTHDTVRNLWQRHQAGGLLRVINSDFLRYDLVLKGAGNVDFTNPCLAAVLKKETGMPSEAIHEVLVNLPVTLVEGVAHNEVESRLQSLVTLGLDVRAELTTFQRLGIEVLEAPDRDALRALLKRFGQLPAGAATPQPPFRIGGRLPELQARILRAALEDAGAVVRYTEGSA